MKVQVKNIHETAMGLTQQSATGQLTESIAVPSLTMPFHFSSTLMGSLTSDMLYQTGKGQIDSNTMTRVMLDSSRKSGTDFPEFVRELTSYMSKWAYNHEYFMAVIAYFMGPNLRPVSSNKINPVTPLMLQKHIAKIVPTNNLFLQMWTDWLVSIFAEFGWIQIDVSTTYLLEREATFPAYNDLVDAVSAHDLRRMIDSLVGTDLSLIKNTLGGDSFRNVSPAFIASQLSAAVAIALQKQKGALIPTDVVDSVLYTLSQVWSPSLPDSMKVDRVLLESDAVQDLASNLALFHVYQNRVSDSELGQLSNHFSESVMRSDIIGIFREAVLELTPFKLRTISDVVSHIGCRVVSNYDTQPGAILLFEDFSFDASITVFDPISQDKQGERRMLITEPSLSVKLSSSVQPVARELSLETLIGNIVGTAQLKAADSRIPSGGATLEFVSPTHLRNMSKAGLSESAYKKVISSPIDDGKAETQKALRLAYDQYVFLAHLATVNASGVKIGSLSAKESDTNQTLILFWETATHLVKPIGESAIMMGSVLTSEPIESCAYMNEKPSSATLAVSSTDIESDSTDTVHMWDWHSASAPLIHENSYTVTVGKSAYTIKVDERQILGLLYQRHTARFLKNELASVLANHWFKETVSTMKTLEVDLRKVKDSAQQHAIQGQLDSYGTLVASKLRKIGSTTMGVNVANRVLSDLQGRMYKKGEIDAFTPLTVGVQKTALEVWSGLVILEALNLVESKTLVDVSNWFNTHNVIGTLVASYTSLE